MRSDFYYNYSSPELDLVAGPELATYNINARNKKSSRALAVTANTGNTAGSWNVVANSGSIAVHFIGFTNGQALIMMRPDGSNPDPYLQVGDDYAYGSSKFSAH